MTIEIKTGLDQIIISGHPGTLANLANMIIQKIHLKDRLSATFVESGSKAIKIELLEINNPTQGAPYPPPQIYEDKASKTELFKYEIGFDFTKDSQINLREHIWPETLAKRIIKSEFGLDPHVDNGANDVRYETENPVLFIELLKILQYASGGGWWCSKPMPQGYNVFHRGIRGAKYNNCPDYPGYAEIMKSYCKQFDDVEQKTYTITSTNDEDDKK